MARLGAKPLGGLRRSWLARCMAQFVVHGCSVRNAHRRVAARESCEFRAIDPQDRPVRMPNET